MRKKIVAGNWKMNKSWKEALELTQQIIDRQTSPEGEEVSLFLFPPFPYLQKLVEMTAEQNIGIGAQNISEEVAGAYTGEVSAGMVSSVGAGYVLIGHSERRQYFGEDSACLLKKMQRAFEAGLQPVYCCGESLDERANDDHFRTVRHQLNEVICQLTADELAKTVIAYEPVWAIGTGQTASAAQAQEMHAFIRDVISEKFGPQKANDLSILYGGSCKPENAMELFRDKDIDGGLIGGASLKADDFIEIAASFS